MFNMKNEDGNKKVKVSYKEGEKIYREKIDKETGKLIREEVELPGKKKEKTEDEKSEKKTILDWIPKPVKVAVGFTAAAAAGIGVGLKMAASKDNKSESEPTENQGFEDNAE